MISNYKSTLLSLLICALASLASSRSNAQDVALVGAKIYVSPYEPPIDNGTVLIYGDRIFAVGAASAVKPGPGTTIIDCKGLVVTAGFWNSHVHILLPGLLHARHQPAGRVDTLLQQMLTRWGFTTVWDLASSLNNTNYIRHNIAAGKITGPRILTVGEPFWMKGGTPIYVKAFLQANHVDMPEVASIAQAKERVRQQVRDGANGIKIFINSIEKNDILTMPEPMVKAITAEAHRLGKPVFAHVSTNRGVTIAMESGVDIIAHTTPMDKAWSPAFAGQLAAKHMALTPTLTLWDIEMKKGGDTSARDIARAMAKAADQMQTFREAGGQVLFGTDVGYIPQFDTSEELLWMARGGMSYKDILASLTTNPAGRFGFGRHSGRIAKGYDADLVVLNADPAKDTLAFSKVLYTISRGKVIYRAK